MSTIYGYPCCEMKRNPITCIHCGKSLHCASCLGKHDKLGKCPKTLQKEGNPNE